jgi:hypothetical protein
MTAKIEDFNVEDFENHYAFTISTETLGPIRMWEIDRSVLSALRKKYNVMGSAPTDEFVANVISLAGRFLNTADEREKGQAISGERASELTEIDLERLSDEIVKHHRYLFQDRTNPQLEQISSEPGNSRVQMTMPQLRFRKRRKETSRQYLQRLIHSLDERDKRQWSEHVKGYSGWGGPLLRLKAVDDLLTDLGEKVILPHNAQDTTNGILAEQVAWNKETAMLIKRLELGARRSHRQIIVANVLAVLAIVISLIFGYMNYRRFAGATQAVSRGSLQVSQEDGNKESGGTKEVTAASDSQGNTH